MENQIEFKFYSPSKNFNNNMMKRAGNPSVICIMLSVLCVCMQILFTMITFTYKAKVFYVLTPFFPEHFDDYNEILLLSDNKTFG